MNAKKTHSGALLCPNCRKLVSRSAPACPYCGLKNPGSPLKNNLLTRGTSGEQMIRLIIVANIVLFVLSLLIDFRPSQMSMSPFSFLSPSNNSLLVLGSTGTIPLFHLHRWWTLVAASFLHGSLLHILFNMLALNRLGPLVIQEFGVKRMVVIYSLSGVIGYLVSAFVGIRLTIGASAAVCGLIGAMLFYGWHRGGAYGKAVFSQLSGWAVGIALFGFALPGINNWGHGGGMAAGFLLAMLLGYSERRKETFVHSAFAAVCLGVTGLVLLWSCVNGLLFLLM